MSSIEYFSSSVERKLKKPKKAEGEKKRKEKANKQQNETRTNNNNQPRDTIASIHVINSHEGSLALLFF